MWSRACTTGAFHPRASSPQFKWQWYVQFMSGTFPVVMGDRGRLVVPAELRERQNMAPGSPMLMIETPRGVLLVSRDQAREMIREELAGRDLVAELLAERRRDASADDAEARSPGVGATGDNAG